MSKNKFKIGNRIKYRGDIYRITGINIWGYDVYPIEYTDREEVRTGIGFCVEDQMEPYEDGLTNYEMKLKEIILDALSNPNWEKDLKNNADKLRLLSMKLV